MSRSTFLSEQRVNRRDGGELKVLWLFLIAIILLGVCAQGVSALSAPGRERAMFTEQLIQASSENLFHLVSGLHSVQML